MSPPKRTIAELVFLYKLEPGLFDIFVEGVTDAGLIRWFLRSEKCEAGSVYPVDSIDVPRPLVEKWGLTPSNRNEVIALCAEVSSLGITARQVCGIVDRDFAPFLGESASLNDLVIVTDYASLDMYFWSEASLGKFLSISFPTVSLSSRQVWDNLITVAQELFLVHLVVREMMHGKYQWVSTEKWLTCSNRQVTLKKEEFIRELLRKNMMPCDFTKFVGEMEERRSGLKDEPRLQMHPDELTIGLHLLLSSELSKAHDKERCRPDAIMPTLRCTCESGTLSTYPMFAELCKRLGRRSN